MWRVARCTVPAAIASAIVLAAAPAANAKAPPNGFQLCGASECAPLVGNAAELVGVDLFYGGATLIAAPQQAPSTFYVLRWQFTDESPGRAYYVPDSGAVRIATPSPGSFAAAGMWLKPAVEALSVLDTTTQGVDPFVPSSPTRVTVGGKSVRDPASYAIVWTAGTPAIPRHPAGWLRIRIVTAPETPWSDPLIDLRVSRRGGWLARDGTFFRIPPTLAVRIRARRSLTG